MGEEELAIIAEKCNGELTYFHNVGGIRVHTEFKSINDARLYLDLLGQAVNLICPSYSTSANGNLNISFGL